MHSGQRRALATMMPLSVLKLSLGRPAMPHSRIRTGSPSDATSENLAERGMPNFWSAETHRAETCECVGVGCGWG